MASGTLLPEYMTSIHGRVASRVLQHDRVSPFTDNMWRSIFYRHDVTSHHRICDVMRSNSTTWRHFLEDVTPCILPDMTLHHGTCDMCILRPTWRHLTVDMLRRVFYHTWRHSYDSMWRHVFYARLHDVTSQRTWRHVWQDSAVHSQRLFNVRSQF